MLSVLERTSNPPFTLKLVTNKNPGTRSVVEQTWKSGKEPEAIRDLGLEWPEGIYSLSHVALPFAPNDPVYGGENPLPSPGIKLGNLAWRGEKNVLNVSPTNMLRLRWNPFYSYLEQSTLEFLELGKGQE